MAGDPIRIEGLGQFYELSKALKAAGDTGMRNALNKELRTRTKPLIKQTRQAARNALPSRGGLANSIARAPQRIVVRTGRTQGDAGVRIVVGASKSGARGANRGVVRHPVFAREGGDRVWVEQKVPSGWFDETLLREGPAVVERAAETAVADVLNGVVKAAAPRRRRTQQGAAGWSQGRFD